MKNFYLCLLSLILLVFTSAKEVSALEVRANGTVLDAETGLVWQQVATRPMSWPAARKYCEQLELANIQDWRLPYKAELLNLAQKTVLIREANQPIFTSVMPDIYWTASHQINPATRIWAVQPTSADASLYKKNAALLNARCLSETAETVYLSLLHKWSAAWSAQNIESYLSFYGSNFVPADGDRQRWMQQRKQRITEAQNIQVKLSNIQLISEQGNLAEIKFTQIYKSYFYGDQVDKVLTLSVEDGRLVIIGERFF